MIGKDRVKAPFAAVATGKPAGPNSKAAMMAFPVSSLSIVHGRTTGRHSQERPPADRTGAVTHGSTPPAVGPCMPPKPGGGAIGPKGRSATVLKSGDRGLAAMPAPILFARTAQPRWPRDLPAPAPRR